MGIPGKDILMLGMSRGDAPYGSTAWSLACSLAKNQRVFYIEHPYSWKDVLLQAGDTRIQARKRLKAENRSTLPPLPDQPEKLQVLVPPIMLPINFLPKGKLYTLLLRKNRTRFNYWLQQQIQQFEIRPEYWLNVFNPYFDPPMDEISKIYYCVDRMKEAVYMRKHGPGLEQTIIRKADLVLSTSQSLLEHTQFSGAHRSFLLRNAADYPMFAKAISIPAPRPIPMRKIDASVNLIYIGAIGDRINVPLIRQIIHQRPDWHWWWIGPIREEAVKEILHLPQCSFLGSLSQRELAAWLQYSDCGVIPFHCNAFTSAIYPLKVHEYLASGRGVVSTPFSRDMLQLHPHTLTAENADEWVLAIEKLLQQNRNDQKRLRSAFASQHSWDSRANQLTELLIDMRLNEEDKPQSEKVSS